MSDPRDRARVFALIEGYRSTALCFLAVRLGLTTLLAGGPRSLDAIASELGAHPPSMARVLRGLVVLEIVREEGELFALTSIGRALHESGQALAILSQEEFAPAWGALVHSAKTGETAFPHVFGMSNWEHRRQHPELNRCFNAETARRTRNVAGWIGSAFDFSGRRAVADVGGGNGTLLAEILRRHTNLRGILFDRAHVVAQAAAIFADAGVSDRATIESGDFFQAVPKGADVYLLKHVLHDWDEERCIALLSACRQALAEGGRVLVVERLLPPKLDSSARVTEAVMADLHMLALNEGGRERTEDELARLFAAAGLGLIGVARHPESALAVVEAG